MVSKDHLDVINRSFEYTCPYCGSHNVEIEASSDTFDVALVTCNVCGVSEWQIAERLVARWRETIRPRIKPLENKQRVIRTHSSDHPIPQEALAIALNSGWKIVMCHPIGNELEYILEKKVKE